MLILYRLCTCYVVVMCIISFALCDPYVIYIAYPSLMYVVWPEFEVVSNLCSLTFCVQQGYSWNGTDSHVGGTGKSICIVMRMRFCFVNRFLD